MDRLKFVAINH